MRDPTIVPKTMATIEALVERVERLLAHHDELRSAHELLLRERDSLRSRLHAARSRIDALLDRLPDDPAASPHGQNEAPGAALFHNGTTQPDNGGPRPPDAP